MKNNNDTVSLAVNCSFPGWSKILLVCYLVSMFGVFFAQSVNNSMVDTCERFVALYRKLDAEIDYKDTLGGLNKKGLGRVNLISIFDGERREREMGHIESYCYNGRHDGSSYRDVDINVVKKEIKYLEQFIQKHESEVQMLLDARDRSGNPYWEGGYIKR